MLRCIFYRQLRRTFHVRVLILLVFCSIILYVNGLINSSYLSFVIYGLKRSTHSSAIITWEIPDFAFYNNQLLLHFGTIAYMPSATQFLSPGFRFPPLRGMNASYMSISELFDRNQLKEMHVFDSQSFEGKHLNIIQTPWIHVALEWLMKISDQNKTIIDIRNEHQGIRPEQLWKIIYTRLIVWVFFLNQKDDVIRVSRSFNYINFVRSCVSLTLANHPNMTRALGIHLRTWAHDLSIGGIASHECSVIYADSPLKHFFKCQLSSHDDLTVVISSIQRAQYSSDQPIYLVTDNHRSPLVLELKRIYASRILNVDEECHRREHTLSAIVENELLMKTKTFLGSFYSTFSLVVGIRRELRHTYFIQTTMQFYLFRYLPLLMIVCILVLLSGIVILIVF